MKMRDYRDEHGRRTFTLDELTELFRGRIICPECSTDATWRDRIEFLGGEAYVYRCRECGCEFIDDPEDEQDDPQAETPPR